MAQENGFQKLDLTETENLAHLTQHLGHLLRFGRPSDKRCKTFNPGVTRVLEITANNDAMDTDKLQHILKIGPEKFQDTLSKATEAGYITVADGKVSATEAGKKAYEEQRAADKKIADELFGALSADEQKSLEEIMGKAVAAWHANDAQ